MTQRELNVLGSKLAKLRNERGESQEEVAKSIGITQASWSMYEAGNRVPSDEVKVRIANHFNSTVGKIFFEEKCNNKLHQRVK